MQRRNFIKNASLALAAGITPGCPAPTSQTIRFGIISDLHYDFTFDALQRLQAFIEEMNRLQPDFILQLGDFCVPLEKNRVVMDVWNRFKGPKYHVIGNHEFDQQCTRQNIIPFFGMPHNYYSFDKNGYHFVIMDSNDPDPYPGNISAEQLQWLDDDMKATGLPVIIFCHHGFDNIAVQNRDSVRVLLDNANQRAGFQQVVACFSGHFHQDYYNHINGTHHIQVNSATYRWLGKDVNNDSFGPEKEKAHPLIRHMAYYKEPLWAYVEIDNSSVMNVLGRQSHWLGKSPEELGKKNADWEYPSVTVISGRKLQL